ncbi:UDP-N-acetylglucosamine 2-epimerase [Lysobacter silvisoli]|uniref:UDP-N-acetylglucosamine 2-epimerase domain-containing protein n=1 Tax=Lysobacter silvisoli TaxID=2293254 RepID=A0A371K0J5_9GAMM|nr:UDP-N-acetylglucosamine 2-epimerase [Lysobacter silvisoli]RDZ27424.1 hypothetical protein DX914_14440 [Lysobacter silvisoli]
MNDHKLVAASAIALAVTLFAIFSIRPWARRIGLVDKPDERKRHRGKIPLIGGLCFFLGTLIGLSYLGYFDRFMTSLMLGAGMIVVAGAIDDAHQLSVRARLLIEAGATGLVIVMSGYYVRNLGEFAVIGDQFGLGPFGIPFTVVAVIGLINAFNMLDGIDGLAASVAMTCIAAILLFDGMHWSAPGVLFLLQVLFAALIPYLFVNLGWPDGRKIFMGDAGSTLIGFVLAWSLIYMSHPRVGRLAPVDVMWCVAVPVMDTLSVMYHRMRAGRSPFHADRRHIHHLLLDTGLKPRAALVLILAFYGLLVGVGYGLREAPEPVSGAVFLIALVAYVLGAAPLLSRMQSARTRRAAAYAAAAPHFDDAPIAADHAAEQAPPLKTLCLFADPPDSVQIAPIAQCLAQDERFESTLCVTTPGEATAAAQVLDEFGLAADIEVGMPAPEHAGSEIMAVSLDGLQRVMDEVQPDLVLVPGDTSATLVASLAAHYHHVPVICVDPVVARADGEAIDEPSRRIALSLAALHVAADDDAGRQLIELGVPAERVLVAGDPDNDADACARVADALANLRPAAHTAVPSSWGAGSPLSSAADRAWQSP